MMQQLQLLPKELTEVLLDWQIELNISENIIIY
jgi:hypothetical protein